MIGPGMRIHLNITMAEDVAMKAHGPLGARFMGTIAAGEEMRILGLVITRGVNTRVGKCES